MDQEYEGISPPGSPGNRSAGSSNLSAKQYFIVNLSKFVIEMIGTAIFTMFFYMMQGRFTSMFMALWVLTLFGLTISGSHFNPCVTLAQMIRKKTTFGRKRRLLGIMYITAQFFGGIIGATAISTLLKEGADWRINVMPAATNCEYQAWTFQRQDENDGLIDCRYDIPPENNSEEDPQEATPNDKRSWKTFQSIVSESFGTFIYLLFFMITTDEKLRYSNDNVKNALVIASSYISSQLLAGGQYVTMSTGPCLNPATAFGLALMQSNFKFPQYILCPFIGCIAAVVFFEFVFVKTQEYLNDESEDEEEEDEIENDSPVQEKSRQVSKNQNTQETLSDD